MPRSEAGGRARPPRAVEVVPPAWKDAADNVRVTVRWMVAAFAGVGAVLFARGFVSTPRLSWRDDATQLAWAWAVGTAGLLALGWLIHQATDLLRPTVFELNDLPERYVEEINLNPRFYLPGGANSYAGYLVRLRALRGQAVACGNEVTRAEKALEVAQRTEPWDVDAVSDAALALERAAVRNESVQYALGVYSTVRKNLLDRAGYWASARGLDAAGWKMAAAAVVAAAGGIGYQLLLASPGDSGTHQGGSASPAVIGESVKADSRAGDELWKQLRLASCQADPGTARIPVVVASGKGTQTDPYVVSTVPTATCVAITFSVVDDVARVSVPKRTLVSDEPGAAPTAG